MSSRRFDEESLDLPQFAKSRWWCFPRFQRDHDERSFAEAQVDLTVRLLRVVLFFAFFVNTWYSASQLWLGHGDVAPLLMTLCIGPCAFITSRLQRSVAVRRLALGLFSAYLNLRVAMPLFPESYHPMTLRQGIPLPCVVKDCCAKSGDKQRTSVIFHFIPRSMPRPTVDGRTIHIHGLLRFSCR